MMVTGALLFLLGTSVSAGPFLPSLPKEILISEHGSKELTIVPSSRTSTIENYIQEGTNVFFKPQFILSADKMPPQLLPLITAIEGDDCKTAIHPLVTPVINEVPLRVAEPVMAVDIPHGPVLRPMEPPQVPLLLEETPMVLEMLHEHPTPIFMDIEKNLPVVPPAPLLPPMEMTRVPMFVEEIPIVKVEDENEIKVPIMIPPGPVLPPMQMPVIGKETPFVTDVSIPPGPVLPPVELPKLPVMVEHASPITILPCEHTVPVAPALMDVEVPKEVKVPLVFPPSPVLPLMEMPMASVVVKEPLHQKPIQIVPFAPVLSPVVMHEINRKEPAVTPVAYHTILMRHDH